MKNKDKAFYKYMQVFFTVPTLINEGPLYDWDDKLWYIKTDLKDRVMGFASVVESTICSCYVLPSFRRKGVMLEIIKVIIREHSGPLNVVSNVQIRPLFKKLGFVRIGEIEGYVILQRR